MNLGRSKEDYLKALLILSRENPQVHAVDLARKLGITKASVSVILKKLIEDGWIERSAAAGHCLFLTEKGKRKAEEIYEKHVFFRDRLIHVGVDKETAEREACALEHAITSDTFGKIKNAAAIQKMA